MYKVFKCLVPTKLVYKTSIGDQNGDQNCDQNVYYQQKLVYKTRIGDQNGDQNGNQKPDQMEWVTKIVTKSQELVTKNGDQK